MTEETFALDDIDEIVKMGDELTVKKRYNDAIRCYDKAIVSEIQ